MDQDRRCLGWFVDDEGRCVACGRPGLAWGNTTRQRVRAHYPLEQRPTY